MFLRNDADVSDAVAAGVDQKAEAVAGIEFPVFFHQVQQVSFWDEAVEKGEQRCAGMVGFRAQGHGEGDGFAGVG